MFPTFFACSYIRATRRHFGGVRKSATDMLQRDALQDAHVRQTPLCVTFGALRFWTNFRIFARCSEYAMIHMTFGTHVRQTALCVTFGARCPSVPPNLSDRLLDDSGAKTAQGLRNGSAWRPFGLPMSPRDALRTILRHAGRVPSVGGSAMHMKWPDDIGREAGIGRTRNWKELNIFRACPC